MAVSLGLTGWWMYIDVPETPNAVVVCVIVFNAAFGFRYVSPAPSHTEAVFILTLVGGQSLGSCKLPKLMVVWNMLTIYSSPPEIMPLTVRAKGVSISTATNWAFNFLVGEITPFLQEHIEWRLYPMHGFFCVCSFVVGELNGCAQFEGHTC